MPQHRNILELQRALEDFADNNLAQEAQNPSGTYPLYLVIAEIQRRTDMRERFAANEQMANLSLPSIAQQKVAELGGVPSVDPSVNQGSNLSPEAMNQGVGSFNQVGVDPNDTQQLASLSPGVMGQQIGPSSVGMQEQFGQGVGGFSQPQPVSMAHGGIVDLPGRLPEQEYGPQEKPLTREEVRRERMNAAWRRKLFQVLGIDAPESPSAPFIDSIPGLAGDMGVQGTRQSASGPFPFGGLDIGRPEVVREADPQTYRHADWADWDVGEPEAGPSGPLDIDVIRNIYSGYVQGPEGETATQRDQPVDPEIAAQTEIERLFEAFGIDSSFGIPRVPSLGGRPDLASGVGSDFDARILAITAEQEEAAIRAAKADKASLGAFRIGAESKEANARRLAELYEGRMGEGPTAEEIGLSDITMSPEARARENKAFMLSGIADTLGTATQAGDIATGLGGVTRGLIDFKRIGREEDVRVLGELGRLQQARKDRVFDATRNALQAEGLATDAANSVAVYAAEQGQQALLSAERYAAMRTSAEEAKLSAVSAMRGTEYQIESDRQLESVRQQAATDRAELQMNTQLKVAIANVMARTTSLGGDGASAGTWTAMMAPLRNRIKDLEERLASDLSYFEGSFSRDEDEAKLAFLEQYWEQTLTYWRMVQTGEEPTDIDIQGWPVNAPLAGQPVGGTDISGAANLEGLNLGRGR